MSVKRFFQQHKMETLSFVLIAFITFAFNGSISLWDQDEAAYAGFAKNMLETGNWLIPDFMWSDIHRKPPLHFWSIALSYKIFGISEFAVRLPATLSILGTYLVVFFWGGKLFGRKMAFYATIILSTTIFIPVLAKVSVTDAGLLFYSTVCAFAIIHVLKDGKIWAILLFWVSIALAILLKGPPILIFTFVFGLLLFILHPDRKNLIRLHPWFFLPLAFVPLFLWGYFTNLKDDGKLINWMLNWYIFKRVSGSVLGQTGPPGLHFVFILAFFAPYFLFFPKAIATFFRSIFKDKGENLILAAWFVAGWLFYEFSPSKLPAYAVVAHVPLAILIAKIMLERTEEHSHLLKIWPIIHFVLAFAISIGLTFGAIFLELSPTFIWSSAVISVTLIIGQLFVLKNFKTKKFVPSLFVVNLFFQFAVWVILMPQLDDFKDSTRKVSHYISTNANPASRIVIANDQGSPPSLPFYLSLNFKDISEEKDFFKMWNKIYYAEEPYVFILAKVHIDQFEQYNGKIKYKEFSSFFVDRKGKANYFVVMNRAAKLDTSRKTKELKTR